MFQMPLDGASQTLHGAAAAAVCAEGHVTHTASKPLGEERRLFGLLQHHQH